MIMTITICEKFHEYLDSWFNILNFSRWRDKITPEYTFYDGYPNGSGKREYSRIF